MATRTISATEALAGFVASLEPGALPDGVRERVKDVILDTFASALAGNSGDEVGQIEALARAVGGPEGPCTVIGGRPASPVGAVLLNGYLVTAATVCDVHRPTLCHVTPEVVPPAMVIAERAGASGSDLITAVAAGLEVTTRVGLGTDYPTFRRHGWHSPGVVGPFGGAASAGRLLRLDEAQQRNAFGLAGSQSAGTFAHWGTPTIKFHQSRGALSGLLAALLAETGFEASPDILEAADGGLYRAYAEGGDPEAVVAGLGERWELENISLRRWPVASSIQAMVTALFAILERRALAPEEIAELRIQLSDTVYRMHGELPWDNRFRALLSTRYVASVIVHDRACWLEQFTPERIADPRLAAFARDQVTVEVDADLPTNGAAVEVTTRDGGRLYERRDVPLGDASDPLDRGQIAGKFRDAARGRMGQDMADRFIDAMSALETVPDVRPLLAALRASDA